MRQEQEKRRKEQDLENKRIKEHELMLKEKQERELKDTAKFEEDQKKKLQQPKTESSLPSLFSQAP